MRKFVPVCPLFVCVAIVLVSPCFGQSSDTLPRFGVGVKFSTLGIGVEAATAVTRRSNVRGGFNAFGYEYDFNHGGIDYGAQLRLRSVEVHYDWFLGHGFHASPGLLVYNGNRAAGSATAPGGRFFNVGGRDYYSNPANPVTGTAEFDFSKNKVAPMVLAGFGNLLRRSGRRFSVNFEAGVVFQGTSKAMLNLNGSACSAPGINCQNVSSYPQIQNDIRAEENKINNGEPPWDVVRKVLKYYPVMSLGFGFRFK